ncbi:LysR family transcriptional regulator [Salinisphaera sp. T5B8]|uniref:LysR family transcriptional regulator n=1 Tax=Salinisphaera sp. T5B8 TaxID=1304154 RepID=UPI00334231BE
MRQFTLKQLRYFVVAGELSSVTGAAKKLHVSQPSISAAIQHIEETTALQLFVRHHARGLSLTPSGRQLLQRARNLLREADGLQQFAVSLGEEVSGELRLVAFPTFAPLYLPQLLRRFTDLHPAVSLYCDEKTQLGIVRGLSRGEYELAFTYDLQIPEDMDFFGLYRLPPYAVVGADHPLSNRESITLEELVHFPMVLLDWALSREYFLSIFTQRGLSPRVAHRAKSMDMVRGLVGNGFGFSLFNTPLSAFGRLTPGRPGLKAIALRDEARALSLGIACPPALRLSPAAEAMRTLAINDEGHVAGFDHPDRPAKSQPED